MKKEKKQQHFLAALMICAWVPPGSSWMILVFLWAEAHSGRTDRYGGHRDNKK